MEEDIHNYSTTVMFRGAPCISVNIDCTKKADQILEIPGLGDCYRYCFKNPYMLNE